MIWQVSAILFTCCPIKAQFIIIIIFMGTVKYYVNQDRFQADLWVLDTMIFLVYTFSCVVHHYFNDSEE